ncbi:MAG: radical SAM protein [Myxococcales bacterium]|nr:radical SAM protein [Myxococcales bacterium]
MTRVALVSCKPPGDPGGSWPSYAVLRVLAEVVHTAPPGVEVRLFDVAEGTADEAWGELERYSPDLLGCSAYVWSFPRLLAMAALLKRKRPETTVVFGGPSARPAMFELDRYRALGQLVDALVTGEGERTFTTMAALPSRDTGSLAALPGVSVKQNGRWTAAVVAPNPDVNALASPYALGLVPKSQVASVETFRGCPLSCAFCQWGASTGRAGTFSARTIARDLEAIADLGFAGVQLIDAGINLNPSAFRNLVEAERSARVFERLPLSFEVYPSRLSDDHLRFFERARLGTVGIGVQSWDRGVLDPLGRHQSEERAREVVRALAGLGAQVFVELILGLPGDSPDGFRRTLERSLELPCQVRVFHCLVLPDALMTRAPPGSNIAFDPRTLRLTSCAGWSEADLERATSSLNGLASSLPATPFSTWVLDGGDAAADRVAPARLREVGAAIALATGGRWQLLRVEPQPGPRLLRMSVNGQEVTVEVRAKDSQRPAFATAAGVELSYRGAPPSETLAALAADAALLGPELARLL